MLRQRSSVLRAIRTPYFSTGQEPVQRRRSLRGGSIIAGAGKRRAPRCRISCSALPLHRHRAGPSQIDLAAGSGQFEQLSRGWQERRRVAPGVGDGQRLPGSILKPAVWAGEQRGP